MDTRKEYLKQVDAQIADIDAKIKALSAERDALVKASIESRMLERLNAIVPEYEYSKILNLPGTLISSKSNDGQFTGGESTTTETWNIGGILYSITFTGDYLSVDTVLHIAKIDKP